MQKLNLFYAYLQARMIAARNDEGATAVEYGLLVSLIAIIVIGGVTLFGAKVDGVFRSVVTKF